MCREEGTGEVERARGETGRRHGQRGSGQQGGRRRWISNEIRITLNDRVKIHGLFFREAGGGVDFTVSVVRCTMTVDSTDLLSSWDNFCYLLNNNQDYFEWNKSIVDMVVQNNTTRHKGRGLWRCWDRSFSSMNSNFLHFFSRCKGSTGNIRDNAWLAVH